MDAALTKFSAKEREYVTSIANAATQVFQKSQMAKRMPDTGVALTELAALKAPGDVRNMLSSLTASLSGTNAGQLRAF